MRYLILLLVASFLFISCGNDAGSAKGNSKALSSKVKSAKAKKGKKNKKASSARYWMFVKKNAQLSDVQLKGLKAISKKYTAKINLLKKQKKWAGKQNLSVRQAMSSARTKEMKALLGAKWSNWESANKKWTAYLMAKKKKSKKKK